MKITIRTAKWSWRISFLSVRLNVIQSCMPYSFFTRTKPFHGLLSLQQRTNSGRKSRWHIRLCLIMTVTVSIVSNHFPKTHFRKSKNEDEKKSDIGFLSIWKKCKIDPKKKVLWISWKTQNGGVRLVSISHMGLFFKEIKGLQQKSKLSNTAAYLGLWHVVLHIHFNSVP